MNGDGKTDILYQQNLTVESVGSDYTQQGTPQITYLVLLENKNLGTSINFSIIKTNSQVSGVKRYPIPLFTNHNKANQNLEYSLISDNKLIYFRSAVDNKVDTRLKSIITGNGVIESITYKPLKQEPCPYNCRPTYTPTTTLANYPNSDIESAATVQVVSMLEKQSASVYKKQLFAYAGATSNLEGLGYLGFRASMRTNWFENDAQIISSISKFDPNLRGANIENYTYLGLVFPVIAINTPAANTPRTSTITINNTRTATETVQATTSIRFLPGATISPTTGNTFVAQITPDYDANGFAETNTIPPSNLISKSLSFYEASVSASKVYKLQNTQSNTYNILESTSSETNTVYDSYSNPTESISKIRNGGVGQQTSISMVGYQSPTTAPYSVGRPTSKTQTVSSSGDSMTSKETYSYGSGTESNLLKTIQKWSNNTSAITEANNYDAFGNITQKTISAAGITPRVTKYEYDPSGRFLTKSTDIEGLSTTFAYNANNGLLNSETNPYNLTTSYLYDPWFKKTTTTDYLGKTNTLAYSRQNEKTLITSTGGGDGSYSEELYDDLGRKIRSGIKDLQNNMSYKDYKYDIYDRNFSISEPYSSSSSLWNTTTYDVYGRPETATDFRNKVIRMVYDKLTITTTDSSTGNTKTSTKNAMGNVITMTEAPIGGTINYSYFANGNLKETNYAGTKITLTQDGWGRKTSLTDPSAGNYTYEYNALGEMTKETTPNGTTTYNLDAWGKPGSKTIVGNNNNTNSNTVYTYSAVADGKLLTKTVFTDAKDASNTITTDFIYDLKKRLTTTKETTGYGAVFTKTLTYDAWGRVDAETSKAELNGKSSTTVIQNEYKNGFAYKIKDAQNPKTLWETKEVNARGQLTKATLGNGISIDNTYDSSGFGYLTKTKHTLTATTATVMELTNDFDLQRGNLNWRKNSLFGNIQENFTYDNQDRLLSYPNELGAVVNQSYEADGRIKENTLGTYNYANTAKKYQNTSVTLSADALTYYKNRGIVALPSPTATRALRVTYNTFKSPVEITEDGVDKLSFVYNDNNSRSVMFYGSLNTDKTTRPNRKYYAADGTMEIKTTPAGTEFVTYIGGDGYAAPVVYKKTYNTAGVAQEQMLYLHRDYQGSILAITDANAVVLEKRQFDAWGAIIKVQNGAGVALAGLTILDRGYTGHEHLQSVGLINMNGRLYDPKLHRFLQPDNYVQDPTNTQNYNRYGYCWNNPLRYTDPSGEFIWFVPLIYAAVNLGVDMIQNKGNMNFGQIAMSLGQGALSGYLGGATSVGGAFLGAGIGQLNRFMPAIPIYQSAGFNLSISPFIGFGSSGFAGGVNLNASGQVGDFAYSASVGVGFNSGTSSLGESSGGSGFWNAGGFAGYNDGHANYGLGYSYNSFGGKTGQGVGAVTIQAGDFGFRLDEDAYIGDDKDRFRTGGMLMTYKVNGDLTLAFGASMMTGEAPDNDDVAGGNPGRKLGMHNPASEKMPTLRAGTMYGGAIYKGQASFYGHNSEKRLHSVQNYIHRNIPSKTPYFPDRGLASRPYSYSGSYHSSYLYY